MGLQERLHNERKARLARMEANAWKPRTIIAEMPPPEPVKVETFNFYFAAPHEVKLVEPDGVQYINPLHVERVALQTILEQVSRESDISEQALRGQGRSARLVLERHRFYYLAARHSAASLVGIGRFLGDRDHTTILHGIRQHCRRNGLVHPRDGVMVPGEARPQKWTDEKLDAVRGMFHRGLLYREIAKEFGISATTICHLVRTMGLSRHKDVA